MGVVALAVVAVVGLGAAVDGLRGAGVSAPVPATTAATAAAAGPTPAPTTSAPVTGAAPSLRPAPASPSGPAASSPPVRVQEVPVVPVPATANGAAWRHLVDQLFTARATAFATGRPALLGAADAPGSALLRADRSLYASVVRGAGYTRAAGLGFDVDGVRLIRAGPTTARLAVAGRQRTFVLQGPAGTRVVRAGPRRELTLQLTRTSPTARWLLAAGSVAPAGSVPAIVATGAGT